MSRSSYLKSYYSDYPEKLMEQFIKDLDALHTSHTYQFENNRKVPLLTREEDERQRNGNKCENCGAEFDKITDSGERVVKVKHHDHKTNKFIEAWCSLCNILNNNIYFKTIVYESSNETPQ